MIHEDHEGKKFGLVYVSGFILPILFLIFLVLRTLPYLVYALALLCVVLLSAKVEDALCRLRRQLALRPPLLEKAIEDAQQLRPLAARALLETSQSSNHADWELARLKPELMIYEKQTKELKQEIQQLTGLISQAERRETDVQQALRRAKLRNGQLLVEMQDLREQLEMQRSYQHELEVEEQIAKQNRQQHSQHSSMSSQEKNENGATERLQETQRLLEDARDRGKDHF